MRLPALLRLSALAGLLAIGLLLVAPVLLSVALAFPLVLLFGVAGLSVRFALLTLACRRTRPLAVVPGRRGIGRRCSFRRSVWYVCEPTAIGIAVWLSLADFLLELVPEIL